MMAHYPPDAERLSETQVATASGPRAFGIWDGDAVVSPRLHQASVRHVTSTKATEHAIGLESHASKARARGIRRRGIDRCHNVQASIAAGTTLHAIVRSRPPPLEPLTARLSRHAGTRRRVRHGEHARLQCRQRD